MNTTDRDYWTTQLTTKPGWHHVLRPQLEPLFFGRDPQLDAGQRQMKDEILELTADLLRRKKIKFGDNRWDNDDDRPLVYRWSRENHYKEGPKGAVLHHTATSREASLDYIGAIDLYRIIVRDLALPMNHAAVNCGHPGYLRNGRQEPIPYHYAVRLGKVEEILKPSMTGLHAGKYDPINLESMGLCWVGNANDAVPSKRDQDLMAEVLQIWKRDYDILYAVPHGDIIDNPRRAYPSCPGRTWNEWGPQLIKSVGLANRRPDILPVRYK